MPDSIWFRTLSAEQQGVLDRSDELPPTADVVIVGAGLIGLATAYYLTDAGVANVCVIDREGPANEASGANAGGLWVANEIGALGPLASLARLSTRLYAELDAKFDFDYRRSGVLKLFFDDAGRAESEGKVEAMRAAGFPVEMLDAKALAEAEPELAPIAAGAVLSSADGQIHPVKLAAALVLDLRSKGVKICRGVEALKLGPPVETTRGPIDADVTVVTAGAWTPLLTQELGWTPPIRPIRGTLIALPPQDSPRIRHIVMGDRFYFWQLAAGPIALGGSEDDLGFQRGVDESTVGAIREDLARYFPSLADLPTLCAWSGFRPMCEDMKPVIGRAPGRENIFVAAGHFKKGVMLAPGTGKTLAAVILGRELEADITELDPGRFALEAAAR